MKRTKKFARANPEGSALVLTLIFVTMFSALAVALATISGANVQVAKNQCTADNVRGSAESGLEVMRYWMSKVAMSGNIAPSERFSHLASSLQDALTAAGIANIVPVAGSSAITIANVPLHSSQGQSFSAVLTKIDDNSVRLEATGQYGSINRTVRSEFQFLERADTVFDFGVASKGPLILSGSVEVDGVNIDVESNAYIECDPVECGTSLALSISGNSSIAGSVKIVNPLAYFSLGPKAGVGGETGDGAGQHIEIGVAPAQFPEMNPQPFIDYAEAHGTAITAAQANQSNQTFTNPIIRANTNPSFSSGTVLKGVIYVEGQNTVTFTGQVTVYGIIVANGSPADDSGTNMLDFRGNVSSYSVETLPASDFGEWLPQQKGTFIMAPGFFASFGGNFAAESGAIAANGIELHGNAGGTINGSIINYGNNNMNVQGNTALRFNRSGLTEVPAGFVPQVSLQYNPSSYSEVTL
jgi:cytoskeletal protein CcmA (bactofilin family)